MAAYARLSLPWSGPSRCTEPKHAGSPVVYCELCHDTGEGLSNRGLQVSFRSDWLSGALLCNTWVILRDSAVAIWIKNRSSVISWTTVETLNAWYLSSDEVYDASGLPHRPFVGFSDLIGTCRALGKYDNIGPAERRRLRKHPLLNRYTEEIVTDLREKARILLSLLAWHFDSRVASLSPGLLRFFDRPHAQLPAICESIYPIYNKLYAVESAQHVKADLTRLMELVQQVIVRKLWVSYD
ncbi:hypothetical protein N7523_005733 [Penicillium sp. IBT 18751x]|nr:hypothetical protein N7523_005733 [Penicillium sp. IBT 18751x]